MSELTKNAAREIEQIHSNWIEYELAGETDRLMALCAEEIELWPPDAQPLLGRAAVSAQTESGTTRILSIEIWDRYIRGSNEIAYLTASYETMYCAVEDATPRQAVGSHLWILQNQNSTWVVALMTWSLWKRAATSESSEPPLRNRH